MIEEGKIYKLKKIKDFIGTNTEDDFKVLKISGDTVYCQNQETKELNMFNKKDFIDPDFPDDIYSDLQIVWEKLNSKMHPMNLSFWKDLQEDMGGMVSASAVSGGGGMAMGSSALGAAPCPALGQITGGSISGAMVNGVPVEGQSVKKKKKKKAKKNEDLLTRSELDACVNSLYKETLDYLLAGALDEYMENLNIILDCNLEEEFEAYAKEQGVELEIAEVILEDEEPVADDYSKYLVQGNLETPHIDVNQTLADNTQSIIKKYLGEDFNEEYEEITEQISKYLDKLNFKFANTEDIVYKKEGEYKYLFKFDNEAGLIKIKVLKGEEVLIEKEYEIDETKDIQPIFDEIEGIYKEYGL